MREGRSTPSSCGVGEEYSEYRGWRERQTYRSSRASNGRMNGARKRGRPRQRWVDTLKGYAIGPTVSNMRRDARDRAGWRGATTVVARGRMRLDGTR